MKIVIDIPDEEYKHIVNPSDPEKALYRGRWFDMIRSGIPYTVESPQGKWIKIFENPFTNGYVCPFCGHKIQVTEQFLPKVTECEVCGAESL